jgi:hypothetical protein
MISKNFHIRHLSSAVLFGLAAVILTSVVAWSGAALAQAAYAQANGGVFELTDLVIEVLEAGDGPATEVGDGTAAFWA